MGKSLFHEEISEDEDCLHKASEEGNKEEVGRLLSTGLLDVNFLKEDASVRWKQKSTPLLKASESGHKDVVQFLLDRGADPNMGTKYGGRLQRRV